MKAIELVVAAATHLRDTQTERKTSMDESKSLHGQAKRQTLNRSRKACMPLMVMLLLLIGTKAWTLETASVAISTKTIQASIFPIAQERGYMREEGIDCKTVFIEATPGIQAMVAGTIEFTNSGTSALVALARGSAPLKVVLATNDQVLQWLITRPNISSPKELKGKKIATTGVAAVGTFMLKQILTKYGLDGVKDVNYIDPGPNNQLTALISGVVDAAVLGPDQRIIALDNGMKELFYFGKEVKNSWGTLAGSDRVIKEKPKTVAGFIKASLKALRWMRQDREGTIAAIVKFSGAERAQSARVYDDVIASFTRNGVVDDETQRNDLMIIRQVAGVTDTIPNARAYDFSFALEADQQLNKANWRP
jgi:ABC-type nitrate/sulfonate/bicarbonate transport system substrate-binding protein